MKSLRVVLLALTLSVCTYAGEMDHGKTNPPPPPSSRAASERTAINDALRETAIGLLQTLLVLV
jgi:hypothetical protein